MGLDVDVYRIDKSKILKYDSDWIYDNIIDKNDYIETVYLRKPYPFWFDFLEIIQYHQGIINKKLIPIIEKCLILHIKEIANKMISGEVEFSYLNSDMKKLVDFYQFLTNHKASCCDEVIYVDWCA